MSEGGSSCSPSCLVGAIRVIRAVVARDRKGWSIEGI